MKFLKWYKEFYRSVCELVKTRLEKARSVGGCNVWKIT